MKKLFIVAALLLLTGLGCTAKQSVVQQPVVASKLTDAQMAQEYLTGPLEILHVIEIGSDRLVVGAVRGVTNSEYCGSMYSESSCYLFYESGSYVDALKPRFLGTFPSAELRDAGVGPVDFKSMEVIDKNHVQFTGSEGDGGEGILYKIELDLRTGATKVLEKHSV